MNIERCGNCVCLAEEMYVTEHTSCTRTLLYRVTRCRHNENSAANTSLPVHRLSCRLQPLHNHLTCLLHPSYHSQGKLFTVLQFCFSSCASLFSMNVCLKGMFYSRVTGLCTLLYLMCIYTVCEQTLLDELLIQSSPMSKHHSL
jgi:hypothetical protein